MSTSIPSMRAAMKGDEIAIAALLMQLQEFEGSHGRTDARHLADALFSENRKVDFRAVVSLENDTITGVALYYPGYDTLSATTGYHLADLVVNARLRRKGIGRALFAQLASQNLLEGGAWISLTALQKNEAAQNFYASLGMTKVAVNFFAIGAPRLSVLSELLQK